MHGEVSVDALAIGDRRLRGIGVAPMGGDAGLVLQGALLPEYFAGVAIEAEHVPAIDDVGRLGAATAKAATRRPTARPAARTTWTTRWSRSAKPATRLGLPLVVRDRRGDEHLVAPDDRRRPGHARDRHLPVHVAVRAPLAGHVLVL